MKKNVLFAITLLFFKTSLSHQTERYKTCDPRNPYEKFAQEKLEPFIKAGRDIALNYNYTPQHSYFPLVIGLSLAAANLRKNLSVTNPSYKVLFGIVLTTATTSLLWDRYQLKRQKDAYSELKKNFVNQEIKSMINKLDSSDYNLDHTFEDKLVHFKVRLQVRTIKDTETFNKEANFLNDTVAAIQKYARALHVSGIYGDKEGTKIGWIARNDFADSRDNIMNFKFSDIQLYLDNK